MQTKKVTVVLFGIYLALLIWMIVYKMNIELLYGRYEVGSINVIPFAGTAVYDGILDFPEILFNVFSFVPFGIYMEMIFRKATWVQNLMVIGLTSLAFELLQYVLLLGIADITDVLANGLGGAIGIIVMYVLTSLWREKTYQRMNVICPALVCLIVCLTYLAL